MKPARAERPKVDRDTRSPIKPLQVSGALLAMGPVLEPALAPPGHASTCPPRWGVPAEVFGPVRAAYHRVSPDDVRRECLARLLVEELERLHHDQAVTSSGHAYVPSGGVHRHRDGEG